MHYEAIGLMNNLYLIRAAYPGYDYSIMFPYWTKLDKIGFLDKLA